MNMLLADGREMKVKVPATLRFVESVSLVFEQFFLARYLSERSMINGGSSYSLVRLHQKYTHVYICFVYN